MPGRLRSNFRSGNLAEHLGLLLLKGVAAIAEVSRPEDIGLDAIATLLRRDQDGNCYAEDSFVVQLKSDSAKTIEYQDHEVEWLIGQTQPMFIGLISRPESRISLYPTLFINQAVMALHAEKVTVRFGCSDLPPFLLGQKWLPWRGESDNGVIVWLGEPLLQWTLSDLIDSNWAKRTYENLKRFLAIARREIQLLSFGQCSVLEWSTNNANSIQSKSGLAKGNPNELENLAERCAPCLHALMMCAMSTRDESGDSLMASLLTIVAALRKMGAEIDPENLFGKFFFALTQSNK